MYLKKIKITNYRSCLETEFELDSQLSALIGPNGTGKTNILTGIKLLRSLLYAGEGYFRADERLQTSISTIKSWFDVDEKSIIHNAKIYLHTDEHNRDEILSSDEKWYMWDITGNKKLFHVPLRALRSNSLRRQQMLRYGHSIYYERLAHYERNMGGYFFRKYNPKVEKVLDKISDFILNLKYSLADKLVLAKIQAKIGGNLKYFISGGAPLSAEVARFFFAAGLRILEGYGLTETSPVLAVNPYQKPKFGTVGKILRSVEIKIAEDGEILAKGPNIMMGYYRMPAETDEVMIDGWFHTGDIGKVDDENYLSITDRKKQLIVTSVGKKVAPQPIEKEIENARHIEQVLLIGEKRNFISALIVPEFENLIKFAKANKLNTEQPEELIKEQAVIDLIQKEVDGRQKHVSNYEKIRKFTLLPEAFTIESGLLTPTMKIKRKVVMEEFGDLIEEMYSG